MAIVPVSGWTETVWSHAGMGRGMAGSRQTDSQQVPAGIGHSTLLSICFPAMFLCSGVHQEGLLGHCCSLGLVGAVSGHMPSSEGDWHLLPMWDGPSRTAP